MPARPATIDDIPEVLRLAALMYATIGQRADEDWFREAERLLEARIGEERTSVFVADAGEPGRLVSCVAATIVERLPGPRNPAARRAAYVQWTCTDPAYRRRGLGQAVLASFGAWVRGTDTKLSPVSRTCARFATNFGAEPDTHAGAAVGVWQRL
jgi:GNAT superfamily N-acetyltransferase